MAHRREILHFVQDGREGQDDGDRQTDHPDSRQVVRQASVAGRCSAAVPPSPALKHRTEPTKPLRGCERVTRVPRISIDGPLADMASIRNPRLLPLGLAASMVAALSLLGSQVLAQEPISVALPTTPMPEACTIEPRTV